MEKLIRGTPHTLTGLFAVVFTVITISDFVRNTMSALLGGKINISETAMATNQCLLFQSCNG